VILVNSRSPSGSQCSVAVDDVLGGDFAVSHLLEAGHERFAYVGGPPGLRQVADRLDGAGQAPDDVAIVGYDDIEFAAAAAVPLSSVRQPRHQLGRTAAQRCSRRHSAPTGTSTVR
jgi:LacI family transcriptional regulator